MPRPPPIPRPLSPAPSSLDGALWSLPSTGPVVTGHPDGRFVVRADDLWVPTRVPGDVHEWRWTNIFAQTRDLFGIGKLQSEAGTRLTAAEPIGLWSSGAPRLLKLPDGPAYRVDFLELHAAVRGTEVSVFLMGLIAARALECGAKRVVLASYPHSRALYDVTGGLQRPVRGWKAARGLLPFEFLEGELQALREAANERRRQE